MEKRIKNKIRYFVSFSYIYKDKTSRFGCCEVWQDDGRFNIVNVQEKIEEDKDFRKGSVTILYFKKLEKGESF